MRDMKITKLLRTPSEYGIPLGYHQETTAKTSIGFSSCQSSEQNSRSGMVRDQTEHHVLAVAPTGAGKGRSVIIPTLLYDNSPAIVLDIKGEAAAVTARHRAEAMGHEVTIIDPWRKLGPNKGQFNPLALLADNPDCLGDEAFAIAAMFEHPSSSPREPYWNERGSALVAGIIAHVLTEPEQEDRTLGRVYQLLHTDDLIYTLATILDKYGDKMNPFAHGQIASLLSLTADQTRMCIVSTAQSMVRGLASRAVQFALKDGLDPQAIILGAPQTIYIVVPPDKLVSHASVLRLLLSSMLGLLTSRTKRPSQPTLFIVDEAAQLGPMPQLRQAVTLTRGFGVKAMLFLQSTAQLKTMFPNDYEVMIENCGTLITFGHQRFSMSDGVAQMMGDVSAEALFAMAPDQIAVKVGREDSQFLKRIDYLADQPFVNRATPNPMFGGLG